MVTIKTIAHVIVMSIPIRWPAFTAMTVMMMPMMTLLSCCRYYISVRAHGEFSTPFASICRYLISPEVSITPPFIAIRRRLRMSTFLDSWSYLRSYSAIQYRSFFWVVAVNNWPFLKATGASLLLRFAQESVPSADTPYANGTFVTEQEAGCFVLNSVYLSAYSMYIFGVIVQSGPPPIPLAADGTPLVLSYTSALYTEDDYPVTCRQVRAPLTSCLHRPACASTLCDAIFCNR
jgi:hypothetical protein